MIGIIFCNHNVWHVHEMGITEPNIKLYFLVTAYTSYTKSERYVARVYQSSEYVLSFCDISKQTVIYSNNHSSLRRRFLVTNHFLISDASSHGLPRYL